MGGLCSSHSQAAYAPSESTQPPPPPLHDDAILSLARWDAQRVFVGSDDRTSSLWSWQKHETVGRFKGHTRGICTVSTAPWMNLAFTGSGDRTIQQWNIDETTPIHTYTQHEATVAALASPNGEWGGPRLFSGSRDTTICLWSVDVGQMVSTAKSSRNIVTHACWVPNEETVVQSSEDLSIHLWDMRTLRSPSQQITGHQYIPTCCDVSADSMYILTSCNGFDGEGCEVKLWDRRQGRLLCDMRGHQQSTTACGFVDSERVVSCSADRTARIWSRDGQQLASVDVVDSGGPLTSLAVLDSGTVAIGMFSGSVYVWQC